MRCWGRPVVWLCLCSCLFAVIVVPVVGAGATAAQPETDNTVTRIQVHADGSATWTVRIRTRLTTDEQVAEYEAFQKRFRDNTSQYLDPFRQRITRVVATAANATGRQMRARNFSASTSIQQVPRRWGVVTYEFTWTNMARTPKERVAVGDVFEGGFYLAPNDTLVMVAPANYSVSSVDPEPTDRSANSVTWEGERNFADGRPRAAFAPTRQTATATPVTEGDSGTFFWWLVAALFAGGAGLWYVLIKLGYVSPPGRFTSEPPAEPEAGTSAPATEPTEELLTDADRVEQLLREHDGRMRQAAVAEELEWSASKTSRVISGMADEGRIEKLRIGRENVLQLTEESRD